MENLCSLSDALFFDIETTGFTARSSSLYLIGCAYYEDDHWHIKQWFAEGPSEQKEILEAFFDFAKTRRFLVHFNGNRFDLPYLAQKSMQLDVTDPLGDFDGIDVYRLIYPYKAFLHLENLKQKSLERFLGVDRDDKYSGGELISVYQEYVGNPTKEALDLLLLHNAKDLEGMLQILPMLSYADLFNDTLQVQKVQYNHYSDENAESKCELLIKANLPQAIPKSLRVNSDGCFAMLEGEDLTLRIPVFEGELKYFYENYKEYYYLPKEDMAMHKSVASFVDRQFREPAKACNCYTRKTSAFLPQWSCAHAPVFQTDYQSADLFLELTEERKKDRAFFAAYAAHVLKHIASCLS